MTGLIIAATLVGLMGITGGILLFSVLPLLLASGALVLLLVALLVVAVMVVPHFVTLDDLKPDLLALIKRETGREVTINGKVGFSLWPVVGLELQDIAIGNPPGFPDPLMLSADTLSLGVAPSSLWSKQLDVREVRLVGGQINLSMNEAGQGNWTLPSAEKKSDGASSTPKASGQSFSVERLAIGRVDVRDTNLGYDSADGKGFDLQDIDLTFAMPGGGKRAQLKGDADYKGQTVTVDLDVSRLDQILGGGKGTVRAVIDQGAGNHLTFEGEVSQSQVSGPLTVSLNSLPDILKLADAGGAGLPVKRLSLKTHVAAARPESVSFQGLTLKVDDVTLVGKMSLNGKRVAGTLDVSPFNLDPWIQPSSGVAPPAPRRPQNRTQERAASDPLALLSRGGADVTLQLAGVTVRGLALGPTTAKVRLQGGKLEASITPASFFDGTLEGRLGLDRRSFTLSSVADKVDIGAMLSHLSGKSRLTGRGTFTANLRGPALFGDTEGVLSGLNGEGRFSVRDGALKGVNVAALVRQAKDVLSGKALMGAQTGAQEESASQETDFTELAGTYVIADGLVRNEDLRMLSPLVRVTGKGTLSLPTQAVDYRIAAALVADLAGQGGLLERNGLVIPVAVTGTFSRLRYQPDLQGLVLNNLGAIDQVGNLLKNQKPAEMRDTLKKGLDGGAQDLLRGFLGGGRP